MSPWLLCCEEELAVLKPGYVSGSLCRVQLASACRATACFLIQGWPLCKMKVVWTALTSLSKNANDLVFSTVTPHNVVLSVMALDIKLSLVF